MVDFVLKEVDHGWLGASDRMMLMYAQTDAQNRQVGSTHSRHHRLVAVCLFDITLSVGWNPVASRFRRGKQRSGCLVRSCLSMYSVCLVEVRPVNSP